MKRGWRDCCCCCCCPVAQFVSDSVTQHTGLPCPSLSPRVCSSSCTLSQRCHPTTSSSVALFSSCPQSFPTSGFFSDELVLHIMWTKYWSLSFSISPSNEYSALISFRTWEPVATLNFCLFPWLVNANNFSSTFLTAREKEALTKSVATYQVSVIILIFSSKDTVSGT